jgi:hypothetical protein
MQYILIGSDALVSNITALALKCISYIINSSTVSIENPHKDIIYVSIKSDDDIDRNSDKLMEIFNKLDIRHKLIIHSENMTTSRIILSKILIKTQIMKLSDVINMYATRKKYAQETGDFDEYNYQLTNDEIKQLKTYENHIFGITNNQNNIGLDDKLAQDLYAQELRSIERNNNTKNDNRYRRKDYRKLMSIFSGRVNPDLIKDMLHMNMSVTDIIDSLSV